MKAYEFEYGLTVKELKEIIKDWPEEYDNGEPTEVWIMTNKRISNIVRTVVPLNKRNQRADILFEPWQKTY